MKNLLSFSKNAISSILCFIIFNANLSKAQSKQEEDIMEVIKTENVAHFNRDTTTLKSVWLHNDDIQRTFILKWGLLDMRGWDKMKKSIEKLTTVNDRKLPPAIKYENIKTHILGNIAFVEFDKVTLKSNNDVDFNSHDSGILINEKNQWKLLKLVSLFTETFTNTTKNLEDDLNDTGYQFLGVNKTPEAIELFKMNVRLNPNSWNVYDSLGEAYAVAGDKKLAIENYEMSLKLKPDNKSGLLALEKLRKE
jgi:tetratricopeptide (TPR) repeat protein